MGNSGKAVRVKTSKNNVVEYRQQRNVMLQLLVRTQEGAAFDIEDLMSYQLTPVPYSLAMADGFLTKTDKAKGVQYHSSCGIQCDISMGWVSCDLHCTKNTGIHHQVFNKMVVFDL